MNDQQTEILQIIFEKKLTETYLANRLGVSPQVLNYQLHHAKTFDTELYNRIKKILEHDHVIVNDLQKKLRMKMLLDEIQSQLNEFYELIEK